MPYPNDGGQAGSYHSGGNSNEYSFNPGVCVLPLAEDAPVLFPDGSNAAEVAAYSPVVVLRLHAQYRLRKFVQVAEKQQNPAPLAAPQDTGAFVFLGGSVAIAASLNNTTVNYDWSVGCSYDFVEVCVSRPVDGLVLGSTPIKTLTDYQNAGQFGYSPPLIGAASFGGKSVTTGYHMGQAIVADPTTGELKTTWGYNQPAYYPGTLFYSDLANGGYPVVLGGT